MNGTITVSVNDYGFELLAPKSYPLEYLVDEHRNILLETNNLENDLENALNLSELRKRRFRSIAQISGLINQGLPGYTKNKSQINLSSGLIFDVFNRYESENLLLKQAHNEVMSEQLEIGRLQSALKRANNQKWIHIKTRRPGPFAFPLLVERLNNRMSNESLILRIKRLQEDAIKKES